MGDGSTPFDDLDAMMEPPPESLGVPLSDDVLEQGIEEGWIDEVDGEYVLRPEKVPDSHIEKVVGDD